MDAKIEQKLIIVFVNSICSVGVKFLTFLNIGTPTCPQTPNQANPPQYSANGHG